MKVLILLLAISFNVSALEVGFDRDSHMLEDSLQGTLSVRCQDGQSSRNAVYRCDESYLRGGSHSKFYVKKSSIDADYVKLQRVGSKYIKGSTFDAKYGISKSSFNLWIATLFQRPLLDYGSNTIKYKFFKNKALVYEGQFEVFVQRGINLNCGWGSYRYNFCPTRSQACDDFFYRNNYCQ